MPWNNEVLSSRAPKAFGARDLATATRPSPNEKAPIAIEVTFGFASLLSVQVLLRRLRNQDDNTQIPAFLATAPRLF